MTKKALLSVALLSLVLLLGPPTFVDAAVEELSVLPDTGVIVDAADTTATSSSSSNNNETNQLLVDDDFRDVFEESELLLEFDNPTDLEFSPGDSSSMLLVSEKTGKLWVVQNYSKGELLTKTVALDIADRMCSNGERGLGGVAFHPNFERTRWVYLYYTYNKYDDCYNGGGQDSGMGAVNRLSRFVLSPSSKTIDVGSEVVFLETPRQPVHNHNGGDIAFGADGQLYLTIGDGGTRSWKNSVGVYYPQALNVLFGKVVRLTEEGDIPAGNPYTPSTGHINSVRCGGTEGEARNATWKCQEIYASGLRNPFRFAMDHDYTGGVRFYINDVGRSSWERIVEGRIGANYGYPLQDGPCQNVGKPHESCVPNDYTTHAIHWYRHDEENGGCVTGGAFVPDDAGWPASFKGSYLYAEYAQGGIYRISRGEGCAYPRCDPPVSDFAPTRKTLSGALKVTSIQFGPYKGRSALYYVSRGNTDKKKGLFRIAFTGAANRSPTAVIHADATVGFSPMTVHFDGTASTDPDGDNLSYAWDLNGDGVTDSTSPHTSYDFTSPGAFFATLTVMDGSGRKGVAVVRIEVDNTPPVPLIESPVEGTTFAVGDKFVLRGSAVDGEDGSLPDSSLVWEVRLHHDSHYHPFLDPTGGNNINLGGAPEPEDFDASTTSHLVVSLTATDSAGLSSTATRILPPKIVEVNIDSYPSGLEVIVYGDSFTTPVTVKTWQNHVFEIEAPDQTVNDRTYMWTSWSDGGCKSHTYVVPSSEPPKIVATFDAVASGVTSSDVTSSEPESPELVSPGSDCELEVSVHTQSAEKEGMKKDTKVFLSIFVPVAVVAVGAAVLLHRKKMRSLYHREGGMVDAAINTKGTSTSVTTEQSGPPVPPSPPPHTISNMCLGRGDF